ncbi:MAG: T9SS C-terminal target domain-containing protein [Gemmatimonadetes bacterium]|nr:MAG: T9SS C-terminal target domain-containing protein [Gemmatimonadota bacterium]
MKKRILLTVLIFGIAVSGWADIPKLGVIEQFTTVGNELCEESNLYVQQLKEHYGVKNAVVIQYHVGDNDPFYQANHTDNDARAEYYGVEYLPMVATSGNSMVQATDPYDINVKMDKVLETDTPLYMSVFHEIEGSTLSVEGSVVAAGEIDGTYNLQIAVIEKEVTEGGMTYYNVMRKLLPDGAGTDFYIASGGDDAYYEFSQSLQIDAGWDTDQLEVIVFVQDPATQGILQAVTTELVEATPSPHHIRLVSEQRVRILPVNTFLENHYMRFINMMDQDDQFDFLLETDMPEGWVASFCVGPICLPDSARIAFEAGQSEGQPEDDGRHMYVTITPMNTPGVGDVIFTARSVTYPSVQQSLHFRVITDGIDVLIVDADGGLDSEQGIASALERAEVTYGIWKASTPITGAEMANFPVVIWNTGRALPTLLESDRAAIQEYMDNLGSILISGQNIGWDLTNAASRNRDPEFYSGVLHANFINDNASSMAVTGVGFAEGLAFNLVDQTSPDVVEPVDDNTFDLYQYGESEVAGLYTGAMVYLGFDPAQIDSDDQRDWTIARILNYFNLAVGAGPVTTGITQTPPAVTLHQNVPNPFNPTTRIRYELPQSSTVKLTIYDVTGRLVRTLVNQPQESGIYDVQWNGHDDAGHVVNSGIYVYQLETETATQTQKMMLLK